MFIKIQNIDGFFKFDKITVVVQNHALAVHIFYYFTLQLDRYLECTLYRDINVFFP